MAELALKLWDVIPKNVQQETIMTPSEFLEEVPWSYFQSRLQSTPDLDSYIEKSLYTLWYRANSSLFTYLRGQTVSQVRKFNEE